MDMDMDIGTDIIRIWMYGYLVYYGYLDEEISITLHLLHHQSMVSLVLFLFELPFLLSFRFCALYYRGCVVCIAFISGGRGRGDVDFGHLGGGWQHHLPRLGKIQPSACVLQVTCLFGKLPVMANSLTEKLPVTASYLTDKLPLRLSASYCSSREGKFPFCPHVPQHHNQLSPGAEYQGPPFSSGGSSYQPEAGGGQDNRQPTELNGPSMGESYRQSEVAFSDRIR